MTESVDGQDDARPGLQQQVVWYYTKARRQLPYIGTDSSGAKIPGGPYAIVQPIAAILVGGLAWFTRPIWAADMSWMVSSAAVAAAAMSAGYFSGMIDVTEQNPLYAVIGAVRRASADPAGTLGGVPIRPRAHKPGRKLTITCAKPSPRILQPASASPPAEAAPQELTGSCPAQAPDFSPGLAGRSTALSEQTFTVEASSAIAKPKAPATPHDPQQNETNPRAVGDRTHQRHLVSRVNQPGPQAALRPRILGLQSEEDVKHRPNPGRQAVTVLASARDPGTSRLSRSNPWVRRASDTRTPTPPGTAAGVFEAGSDAVRVSGLESLLAASRAGANLQSSGQECWTE